jgi:hypothetical protein
VLYAAPSPILVDLRLGAEHQHAAAPPVGPLLIENILRSLFEGLELLRLWLLLRRTGLLGTRRSFALLRIAAERRQGFFEALLRPLLRALGLLELLLPELLRSLLLLLRSLLQVLPRLLLLRRRLRFVELFRELPGLLLELLLFLGKLLASLLEIALLILLLLFELFALFG